MILGNAAVLKDQLSRLRGAQPHFLFNPSNPETGCSLWHHKRSDAFSSQTFINSRERHHQVCPSAIRDVVLMTIEHPLVAI